MQPFVFEFVSGDGGENVRGASLTGGAGCAHFSHGVHEAAVSNGSQQEWDSEIEAENASAQGAISVGDRMTRTEGDVLIDAAILAEGHLTIGAAIKVVEYGLGYTPLGDGSEISDADNVRRGDGTRG